MYKFGGNKKGIFINFVEIGGICIIGLGVQVPLNIEYSITLKMSSYFFAVCIYIYYAHAYNVCMQCYTYLCLYVWWYVCVFQQICCPKQFLICCLLTTLQHCVHAVVMVIELCSTCPRSRRLFCGLRFGLREEWVFCSGTALCF